MALLKGHLHRRRNRRPKVLVGSWLVALFILLLVQPQALVGAGAPREYQVKAVFLFTFARFVDWPALAFGNPEAPFVIGVLGEDPFGAQLDEAVRDEKISNRPLIVHRYRNVEEVDLCHILFISGAENGRMDQVFAVLKGRNILTVGDSDGFSKRGGMIRFVNENNKIRLKINQDAATSVGLTISSKLLRLAEIVPGQKG